MAVRSAVRRRVIEIAGRLAALMDEGEAPANAVGLLVAQGVVPRATPDASLSSAFFGALPNRASSIAEYVRVNEEQNRGEDAVRYLSQLRPETRRSRAALSVIGIEFILLLFVVLIYAIFVLPQLRASFAATGVSLPRFTQVVFALASPLSPLIWVVAVALAGSVLWQVLPLLIGRWMGPLDRLVLAIPVVGTRMTRYNAEQMSGWLGFAPADEAGRRAAVDAAKIWHRGVLSRTCAGLLANAEHGRGISAGLAGSSAFDREFAATLANSNSDACRKALRSRWRACAKVPDAGEASVAALTHVALGIVVAAVVIAMYLPLFKLAATVS